MLSRIRNTYCNPLFKKLIFDSSKIIPSTYVFKKENYSSSSEAKQLEFPCLDVLENRTKSLYNGPEPTYNSIVKGYKTFEYSDQLSLDFGGELNGFKIAYETWGELNKDASNAILLHTGLSGSSHAKSNEGNPNPGWWEKFIGPGLSIDTSKFFVICTNVIGGCYGSTGPSSVDPNSKDDQRYATRFPMLTIFDMVRAQFLLLDSLGIKKLHASVGSSMGGMQSLAAGILFKDRVGRIVSISSCAKSHPSSIALRFVQRQVLMTDPNWNKGDYYSKIPPHIGMKLAREIATITYRSGPEWEKRFGLNRMEPDSPPALCPDFLIETYLDHQGEKFCLNYDANSLLYISKAMDMFDLSYNSLKLLPITSKQIGELTPKASNFNSSLAQGLSLLSSIPTLVIGVQSDILFPCWQQKEIATLMKLTSKDVYYYELDAEYGHDTFLIDLNSVGPALKGHLEQRR